MRDYTTNKYCDFLWIKDLLELKRSGKNDFALEIKKGERTIKCNVINVIIFGTIVEVKEIEHKKVLYQVDDGTGVIACKRNDEQFEQILGMIESEQVDILSQTVDIQNSFEQSYVIDTSADDSVFNDRSLQAEDITFNKKSQLKSLQSIWDDIFRSFSSLIESYSVGDSVIIEGKLYTYFNMNQIYINNIRAIDVAEEIMLVSNKLQHGLDQCIKTEALKSKTDFEERLSGFATFDNIPSLNPAVSIPKIKTPESNNDMITAKPEVVSPNLEPTITFDTFTSSMKVQDTCFGF